MSMQSLTLSMRSRDFPSSNCRQSVEPSKWPSRSKLFSGKAWPPNNPMLGLFGNKRDKNHLIVITLASCRYDTFMEAGPENITKLCGGLRARGGLTVDLEWVNNLPKRVRIRAANPVETRLRIGDEAHPLRMEGRTTLEFLDKP